MTDAVPSATEGVPFMTGDALINGLSIQTDMAGIRQDLGVCPQFDILWPEITVREHLMLYAAIKGFTKQQQEDQAVTAANDVGEYVIALRDKLLACSVVLGHDVCVHQAYE